MTNILINNGFDLNKQNRFLNTPLHIAFNNRTNKLSPELIVKLLYYGNLNIQNLKGETPLHYFLKNYNWNNYNLILKNKKIDIFQSDNNKVSPISYINNNDLSNFLDTIAVSYSNQLDKLMSYDINYNKCYKLSNTNKIKDRECINIIKEHILKHKKSIPTKKNNKDLKTELRIVEGYYTDYGKFNSDTIHNMIYTIQLLYKYKTLFIPYQYFIHDKVITEKLYLINMSYPVNTRQLIIYELLRIYTDYFYEFFPYLIIWKSKTEYYYNKNLKLYLLNPLYSNNIRFIFLKLTIISNVNMGTHANIIIFDKKTGILERFEPYGIIPYIDNKSLDDMIQSKIGIILKQYLDTKNIKLKYYSPSDYMIDVSFQTISNDDDSQYRKLGDPRGYCLAWTFWYLEMRLNNPDLLPNELVKKSISIISKSDKVRDSKHSFIDFIRNYSNKLDTMKNDYLNKIGFNNKMIYNMVFSSDDKNKLINQFEVSFNDLVNRL
jgi:hypothetical protein